jgi:hypothetical protein
MKKRGKGEREKGKGERGLINPIFKNRGFTSGMLINERMSVW